MRQTTRTMAALLAVWMGAATAQAATRVVTSTADDGSAGTLRAELAAAADGDTITFSLPSYPASIDLATALLIDKSVTIQGPGEAQLQLLSSSFFGSYLVQVGTGGPNAALDARLSGVSVRITDGQVGVAVDGAPTARLSLDRVTVDAVDALGSNLRWGVLVFGSASAHVSNSSFRNLGIGVINFGNKNAPVPNTIDVMQSTFEGNGAGVGAAVNTEVNVTNSTIWASTIADVVTGGGSVSLLHTTLGGGGPIGVLAEAGQVTVRNSIVADHSDSNCIVGAVQGGTITSNGYNLDSDGSCVFVSTGDQSGTVLNPLDAGLDAAPQDNGGATRTVALQPTSIALDGVPTSACLDLAGQPLNVDQRGSVRPSGLGCDIGAFERFVGMPFKALQLGLRRGSASFKLEGSYTLNDAGNGYTPALDGLQLTLGGYTVVIPGSSLRAPKVKGGAWSFKGTVDGVQLEVKISAPVRNKGKIEVEASRVTLVGADPLSVSLVLGDDFGTVLATRLR